MKLFLLELDDDHEGCERIDHVQQVVVRADDEALARHLFATTPPVDGGPGDEGAQAWLDPAQSRCTEIKPAGPSKVIVTNTR